METKTTYLAVGQWCWGVGDTPEAAKKEARKNGSAFKPRPGHPGGFAVYVNEHPADKPGPACDRYGGREWYGRIKWLAGPEIYDRGTDWVGSLFVEETPTT